MRLRPHHIDSTLFLLNPNQIGPSVPLAGRLLRLVPTILSGVAHQRQTLKHVIENAASARGSRAPSNSHFVDRAAAHDKKPLPLLTISPGYVYTLSGTNSQ